jgi:hypothetical protein
MPEKFNGHTKLNISLGILAKYCFCSKIKSNWTSVTKNGFVEEYLSSKSCTESAAAWRVTWSPHSPLLIEFYNKSKGSFG